MVNHHGFRETSIADVRCGDAVLYQGEIYVLIDLSVIGDGCTLVHMILWDPPHTGIVLMFSDTGTLETRPQEELGR